MAKIAGKLVTLQVSTDNGTTYKTLICETSSGINMTRETTTSPLTKCDSATVSPDLTTLAAGATFPFDALVDDSPLTTQVTYGDLLTIFANATKVKLKREYPAGTGTKFYTSADAYLTSLSEASTADGFTSFTGEFSMTGSLDITP